MAGVCVACSSHAVQQDLQALRVMQGRLGLWVLRDRKGIRDLKGKKVMKGKKDLLVSFGLLVVCFRLERPRLGRGLWAVASRVWSDFVFRVGSRSDFVRDSAGCCSGRIVLVFAVSCSIVATCLGS